MSYTKELEYGNDTRHRLKPETIFCGMKIWRKGDEEVDLFVRFVSLQGFSLGSFDVYYSCN